MVTGYSKPKRQPWIWERTRLLLPPNVQASRRHHPVLACTTTPRSECVQYQRLLPQLAARGKSSRRPQYKRESHNNASYDETRPSAMASLRRVHVHRRAVKGEEGAKGGGCWEGLRGMIGPALGFLRGSKVARRLAGLQTGPTPRLRWTSSPLRPAAPPPQRTQTHAARRALSNRP